MAISLTDIVQNPDTRAGRTFDIVVICFVIYSIITLTIETLPDLPDSTKAALNISEIVVTVLFTVEYILRITTASHKLSYIFSFYGLIDLVAILPFYLSMGLDLRALRAFRLFRIFHIFKIARYSNAMSRFIKALALAKEESILFLLATSIVLYLSAVGIYYFEHDAQPEQFKSILHSLWWAVATLTTVGYGDIYPITAGGKFFTFVTLMVGLGIVAVPAGLVAAALSKVREEERREEEHDIE